MPDMLAPTSALAMAMPAAFCQRGEVFLNATGPDTDAYRTLLVGGLRVFGQACCKQEAPDRAGAKRAELEPQGG